MAAPSTPTGFYLQQGNGQAYVLCNLTSGATSYVVYRSTDGVAFSQIANPSVPQYLDTSVTVGTLYYYTMSAKNGSGESAQTTAQSIVPTRTGDMALSQIRLAAQQRADRVNSQFVTLPEWNSYINQSYFELYDLLVDTYEDYFVQTPYTFQTDGNQQYTLPNDFYKLMGVDLGLAGNSNAWVTLKKFEFIGRNRYVFPQLTSTYLGVFNLRYRLVGNTLMFIPTPAGAQYIRAWYIPKMTQLLQESDTLVGVSGWTEYVIVDAAIKALQKEESDASVLMAQKMALMKRIEESAMNRDAGQPDAISDVRGNAERWGGSGAPNGDGSYGGY
jgi:hypothetical protein